MIDWCWLWNLIWKIWRNKDSKNWFCTFFLSFLDFFLEYDDSNRAYITKKLYNSLLTVKLGSSIYSYIKLDKYKSENCSHYIPHPFQPYHDQSVPCLVMKSPAARFAQQIRSRKTESCWTNLHWLAWGSSINYARGHNCKRI